MILATWIATPLIIIGPSIPVAVLPPAQKSPQQPTFALPQDATIDDPQRPDDDDSAVIMPRDVVEPTSDSWNAVQQPGGWKESTAMVDLPIAAAAGVGGRTEAATEAGHHRATKSRSQREPIRSAVTILLGLWAAVAMFLSARIFRRAGRTWNCIRKSSVCESLTVRHFDAIAETLGPLPAFEIRSSDAVAGPCTAGWWRPVVLLPTGWLESQPPSQQRMVLAHELSHARGRDALWDAVAQFSHALWWFHPLVLLLVQSHRLCCEHRCDQSASRIGRDADAYRKQLAKWALEFNEQPVDMMATLAMAQRSLMIRRLRWLQQNRVAKPLTKRLLAVCVGLAVVFCFLVATVAPTRRASGAAQVIQGPVVEGPVIQDSAAKKDSGSAASPARDGGAEDSKTEAAPDTVVQQPTFRPIVWGDQPLGVDLSQSVDFELRVVDAADQPIKHAEVMLGTITDKMGVTASLPMVTGCSTNESGIATVKIPKGTAKVGLTTTAAGFARQQKDFNTEGTAEIQLQRGRVITVRAVDEDGSVLEDAFPILQGSRILGREFVRQGDGTHVSPVVSLNRRWMQVVASLPGQPLLFSGLVDVASERLIDENGVMQLGMAPGVLLEGRLDDSVPRPVKNGFVELMINQGEDHRISPRGLQWQDTVAIKPDGTFVFVSLPPGGHAQLFALGEGFQTKNPTEQELRDYFDRYDAGDVNVINAALGRPDILPQLVRLDREHVEVTLSCRPTASLDVQVINPAGEPIAGAVGSMNPNGYFLGGELFIPGTEMSTAAMVHPNVNALNMLVGLVAHSPREFIQNSFLSVKTDAAGIARFRNIPSRKDSYEIKADGYVMAAYPTSPAIDPGRYALIQLKDGETARRTITMERDVPRDDRELMVVYHDGRPLADTELTLTDITTSENDDDWNQWSVQRLGPVSQGKTDPNGRLLISYPSTLDGKPVRSLRLFVEGQPEKDVYCRSYVTVPANRDGRVIKIVPAKKPREKNALRAAQASYSDLNVDADLSLPAMLDQVVTKPTVLGLRRLLTKNGFDAAEPLELQPDRSRITNNDHRAVVRIESIAGTRIVALASVRPNGATWSDKPRGGFPPEAAFVFDDAGNLITMLGGGTSASGSNENIMITNLGSTGDHFLRTSAFESHPPYEYYSRWYRIGAETKPALTVYHYANSNSWSGINGDSKPIAEFGFLGYEFNGQDIDHTLPGVTADGATVPRRILWDRQQKKFFGPSTQMFGNRSLYRVLTNESSEFQAIEATTKTIVAAGGRRDFQNWHQWTVTIPHSGTYTARLIIRDRDGNTTRTFEEHTLAGGQHSFQLQVDPAGQSESNSKLVVMLDASDTTNKTEYRIPRMQIDDRPSVAGQGVYVASEPPLKLFDKRLADDKQSVVWVIEAK